MYFGVALGLGLVGLVGPLMPLGLAVGSDRASAATGRRGVAHYWHIHDHDRPLGIPTSQRGSKWSGAVLSVSYNCAHTENTEKYGLCRHWYKLIHPCRHPGKDIQTYTVNV